MTILEFVKKSLRKNKEVDLPSPSHKNDNELYQRGLIITYNEAPLPILDFDSYKEAIIKIIKGSYPNFTVGI